MSSLTDIIFLLLIFFMLTSSMVQINLDLPESDSKTVTETSIIVMIDKKGVHKLNGKVLPKSKLRSALRTEVNKAKTKKEAGIAIAAEKGVRWRDVNRVLTYASELNVKAILATKPKKE